MTNTPKPQANTVEEILDLAGFQIFPASANKDRAKAKQQIQALITEARIDELKRLYPQMELGYSGGATVLRATKVDNRLAQLKENK